MSQGATSASETQTPSNSGCRHAVPAASSSGEASSGVATAIASAPMPASVASTIFTLPARSFPITAMVWLPRHRPRRILRV